jgi:hypothetical protein
MLRIRSRDPALFFTPGSGMEKIPDPGWEKIRILDPGSTKDMPDHISESLVTIIWVKNAQILCCGSGSDAFVTLSGLSSMAKISGLSSMAQISGLSSMATGKDFWTVFYDGIFSLMRTVKFRAPSRIPPFDLGSWSSSTQRN